jgi:hypothetical protein
VNVKKAQHWDCRGYFFAAAAEEMRRSLVGTPGRTQRVKRGREFRRVATTEHATAEPDGD